MRVRESIAAILLFLIGCDCLHAHQIAEMPMALEVHGDHVTAIIEADAAYMLPEFRGDEDEEAKDLAWLRQQGPAGWERIENESERYWADCLRLEADGSPLAWSFRIPEFHRDQPRFMTEGAAEELPLVAIRIDAELPPGTRRLEAVWNEPFGVVLILTTGQGNEAETIPMVSGERAVVAGRATDQEPMRPAESSAGFWVKMGFLHILPLGLDHILFVLGLFLLVPKWKPLLQQTIVFTLAHSITLAAAVLGWVSFSPTLVEIMIAASIAWVGIENLWVKELGKCRLALVAAFGLIHGLGFASVLAELLPASRPDELPPALLGFNIGVELGQIAVLLVAFACFGWIGKAFKQVRQVGSMLIALAGFVMILERIAGIEVTQTF